MKERKQNKPILKDVKPQKQKGLVTRTNVNTTIDNEVLAVAKAYALEHKIPLTRVLDAALILYIKQQCEDEQLSMAL